MVGRPVTLFERFRRAIGWERRTREHDRRSYDPLEVLLTWDRRRGGDRRWRSFRLHIVRDDAKEAG